MTILRTGASGLVCMVALLSCRPVEQDESTNNVANSIAVKEPAMPVVEPPRDRASLLLAVARAASAASLGKDDAAAQRDLAGDRFEFRLRFGCPRPDRDKPGNGAFSVRFDPTTRKLQLSAASNISADQTLVAAVAGEEVEAVEGFWIEHPWVLAAGCPAVSTPVSEPQDDANPPTDESPETEPAQAEQDPQDKALVLPRAAIAQFLTANDPRTDRRGQRPYESTTTLPEGIQPSRQGYDLVLSGRLRALSNGKVITCPAVTPDQPPTCLVSALFDRVWIAHPETGEIIAQWGRH